MIRVDNGTNEIDAVYATDLVVTLGAGRVWMLDRARGELRTLDLEDL